MRFPGAVGFDVAEITRVAFGGIGSTVMVMRRVEMRSRGSGIRRRAIPFVVNMKAVRARTEILDVAGNFNLITALGECDRAGHLTVCFRVELGRGLGGILSAGNG